MSLRLTLLAVILAGCTATTPAPTPTPTAAATPWTASNDQVTVQSDGQVTVKVAGTELKYKLDEPRLQKLAAARGQQAAEEEVLKTLVPRPFAVDEGGLWAGGRLTEGIEAGVSRLVFVEGKGGGGQSLTLIPPPTGFKSGEVIVVVGKRDAGQAGIEQSGPVFQVEGSALWR